MINLSPRKFLLITGRTSSGIAIPFEEIPVDTDLLDQTVMYVSTPREIIMRVTLNVGKMHYRIPETVVSNTDQATWEMAQTFEIKAENDCIVKAIEIQTPALLLARLILQGVDSKDWHRLGVPRTNMLGHRVKNFSFPNGLITVASTAERDYSMRTA